MIVLTRLLCFLEGKIYLTRSYLYRRVVVLTTPNTKMYEDMTTTRLATSYSYNSDTVCVRVLCHAVLQYYVEPLDTQKKVGE